MHKILRCFFIFSFLKFNIVRCSCLTMRVHFFRLVIFKLNSARFKWVKENWKKKYPRFICKFFCGNFSRALTSPCKHERTTHKKRRHSIQMWMFIGSVDASDAQKKKKSHTHTHKDEETQEWNLIKWNCVTCVLIAFLSFDRDFNENSLSFWHTLLFFSFLRFFFFHLL